MKIIKTTDPMTHELNEIVAAIDRNDLAFLKGKINNSNASLRIKAEDNDSLLMHAFAFGSKVVCDLLIENGASVLQKNDLGESAVHSIVYSGNPELLSYFSEKYNLDLNAQANDGTTPLILAAGLEKWQVFERLIHLGANINATDLEGNAPIHLCCSIGNKSAVELLVNRGAILNQKTKKGNLPLALAVNGNHAEIVKYLFSRIYS